MNKFDTHGGHYEPQGYMRVNAGGSHEENPNGGVQVGVDPEGTPNLLEEGEPVYNDYVYSDNITADADILKKHNVPFKYGGKLYSEIADTFVDEVAETPLDPIANNGLNAMLVRLADAQEEQKSIQQQRELEEELAAMSPEELDELEQALSQQEAQPQGVMPMQEPVTEGVAEGVTPELVQQPTMADGGRLYWLGGDLLYNGKKITSQGYFTPFRLSGGANPYFWITPRGRKAAPDSGNPFVYSNSPNTRIVTVPEVIDEESKAVVDTKSVIPDESMGRPITSRRAFASSKYPLSQLSPEDLDVIDTEASRAMRPDYSLLPRVDNPYAPGLGRKDAKGNTIMYGRPADNPTYAEVNPNLVPREVTSPSLRTVSSSPASPAKTASVSDTGMLPTWPRYAGAVTSGLLGLYNAFQEPDRYTTPDYTPVLPEGRMHFIDPVYNPVDQNQMVNDVLASSAGTTRAINNSGLGAATQATLLAQDYNTGRNLGTALATAREANNQRLNQVIAQRNQTAGTLGQFNYGQSRDRAQILNDAAVRNLHNELYRQRLNYEAEGQKYAAIQNQIDSVAQALANIGRENAAMNMINGDEAYAYGLSRLFDPYYKGRIAACGGKIKKTKK